MKLLFDDFIRNCEQFLKKLRGSLVLDLQFDSKWTPLQDNFFTVHL